MRSILLILFMFSVTTGQSQSLNEYLDTYYYCVWDLPECAGPKWLPSDPDLYDGKAKKRLLELLKNKVTDQEKERIVKYTLNKIIHSKIEGLEKALADTVKFDYGQQRIQGFINRLDSMRVLTSIQLDTFSPYMRALHELEERIENEQVDNRLIILSGALGEQQFIDVLKEALTDSSNRYDHNTIKLALARNSVKPYYREMLQLNSISIPHKPAKDFPGLPYDALTDFSQRSSNLIYMASQESIRELAKWLNLTGDQYRYESISHSDIYTTVGHETVVVLRSVILNEDFQSHFLKAREYYQTQDVTTEDLKFTRKWMRDNFGQYKINTKYFPQDVQAELTYNY